MASAGSTASAPVEATGPRGGRAAAACSTILRLWSISFIRTMYRSKLSPLFAERDLEIHAVVHKVGPGLTDVVGRRPWNEGTVRSSRRKWPHRPP